ncbi:hypothetical protein CYY_003638 [Polysphondylium violaceum]|uniref:C2 domain-containing protein n=1 Tax=Polysphondylium violaceum TaxID=133409 RepID=A0A8J4Q6K9_9MYCE|nr:hypothetical protein CYY_003638 [Polysphondylium violaceum]
MMDIRTLTLNIIEGKELIGADKGGKSSDPYVKFHVDGQTYKTEVKKETLSPIWNQIFQLPNINCDSTVFNFEVFDWDRIGSHDSLSGVTVPCSLFKQNALNGVKDQWLNLDKKGFIRVGFEFYPPYQTLNGAAPVPVNPIPTFNNVSISNNMGILPPPVHFPPLYLSTIPQDTKAEFILPNEVYFKKTYITGEPVDASLILYVSQPCVFVRSLYVSFRGKVTFNGKKTKDLVQDYRNLLHCVQTAPNQKTRLDRGKHIFPFQFFIPKECYSTYSMKGYDVSYKFVFNADIVNLPDIEIAKAINVVNIEDTIHRVTKSPINQDASKSPLTGGNISIKVKSPKNTFYPGEDIELDVFVENNSNKKIKKIDFTVHRTISEFGPTEYENSVQTTKQFFPKIKQKTSHSQNMVIELPSHLVRSIYQPKMIKIEYQIHAVLDIPKCVDLSIKIPINIVLPDPKIEPVTSALDEIASIPRYIKDWSIRNFNSWLLFKVKCPECVHNPIFYQYNLSGEELMTMDRNFLASNVLVGSGPRNQEIFTALCEEMDKILAVRNFLKDNQLAQYIPTFESETITFDLVKDLTLYDLGSLGLNIGDTKRFELLIKKLNQ